MANTSTMPNPLPTAPSRPELVRLDAACVADHQQAHAPGTLILERLSTGLIPRYVGPPTDVPPQFAKVAQTHTLPNSTLLPAFVNAHTHLDLTALGPQPFDPAADSFGQWLGMIVRNRPTEPNAIRDSVQLGLELSLAGGVVAVGDIAGQTTTPRIEPFEALDASPLRGVSFLEFFAIGTRENHGLKAIEAALEQFAAQLAVTDPLRARLGVQPHAPYSVSTRAYHALQGFLPPHTPRSTHVAETLAEREFITAGTGPQADFLHTLGAWDDELFEAIGQGRTPIGHLESTLHAPGDPWLLAHSNDTSDHDLAILAQAGASVAFCPRSHRYFGHAADLPAHRWPEMLRRGINACFATDSIVNLDTEDRITPLDDARLVWQSYVESGETLNPHTLLRMLTTNPAQALGLDPAEFAFGPFAESAGPLAGLVEIPGCHSLAEVLGANTAPRLLYVRNHSDLSGI